MKGFDYRTITSTEALKAEKRKTLDEINGTQKRMRQSAVSAVMPRNKSLMESPIGVVRYAAYGITAYKTIRSVRRFMKFFGKGRKRR